MMAVAAAQQPVSAQAVGNAFITQYYHIQRQSPEIVHKFYQDISKLGRPDDNGIMSTTTTMQAINEKILSLNYGEYRAVIKSVDAQESFNGGVHVLVTGCLSGSDNMIRNFTQTFFLAPQEKGFFVLNDMFRYMEDIKHDNENKSSATDVEAPLTPEHDASHVQENHISEQEMVSMEVNEEEAQNPSVDGEVSIEEEEVPVAEVVDEVEEVPVAEVVDEVPDDSQMVVESNSKSEEVPKKSYASIVMDMKESVVSFSSPAPALRRSVVKNQEQQVNLSQPVASVAERSVSGSDAIENGNSQEGEAEGYSVYIKGLPFNATPGQLEDEFKRFGPIMSGGIQVRSNRLQGFCFGFVEFEVESAVQKAIEASPVTIGGRQVFVEEKRSTISRVNKGRFSTGRGSGSRNEGGRGRGNYGSGNGNYGSGRGYSRGDFNGRTEFGNRSSNRGGFSNREAGGYQRSDSMGSNGGRMNRGGGMPANGTAKTVAPRVSTTA